MPRLHDRDVVTELDAEIRAMIALDGPMGVERYMQLCLQHPRYGYYTANPAIGRDFTTAPEISQMFGELIGLWAAQIWLAIGAPAKFRLVELGPGRGTLMADALRATRKIPGFAEAIRVDLVDTSAPLVAQQRQRLAGAAAHVAWYATLDELPPGPAAIIANEFFDALPVRHYVRATDGWHERLIGLDDAGQLVLGAARAPIDVAPSIGEPGQVLEVGHAAGAAMTRLATRIARDGGALLVCDYGHTASGLGETLQAMRRGAPADILRDAGHADLTVHVDFAALVRAAEAAGAATHGPVAQGVLLQRLGIRQRAEILRRKADRHQAEAIDAALERLIGARSGMASLFKALAVTRRDAGTPPGFDEEVTA